MGGTWDRGYISGRDLGPRLHKWAGPGTKATRLNQVLVHFLVTLKFSA